jgi:hypothetical protein
MGWIEFAIILFSGCATFTLGYVAGWAHGFEEARRSIVRNLDELERSWRR